MSRAAEDHSTLEYVPKAEVSSSYIYSVPDDSPLQVNQVIPWTSTQPPEPAPAITPAKRPSLFLRWPFLILYAILIAVLAGLGGGFIGEDITTKRLEKDTVARSDLSQVCDSMSNQSANPSPSNLPTSTATPRPSSSATPTIFQRTIPVPTTGCTPPNQQRSFKSISNFLGVTYTTYCATGWMSNELFALSAASPSDCVEACVMYNGHKGTADRSCVGGGYIPAWWNQSKAMDESGGMPYNCFLKSSDAGTGRNEKSVEIVSLCLDGACKDVLGGG